MTTDGTTKTKAAGKYAEVNGINLYYEIHGAGRPLILLHGGLMSGETFGPVLPTNTRSSSPTSRDTAGPLTSTARSTCALWPTISRR